LVGKRHRAKSSGLAILPLSLPPVVHHIDAVISRHIVHSVSSKILLA